MLKITAKTTNQTDDSKETFEIYQEKEQVFLNKKAQTWDMVEVKPNLYHIIKDAKSYLVEVLEINKSTKEFTIKVNGKVYQLTAQDNLDLLLKSLGMDKVTTAKISEVKAPMPGLLISTKVSEGDEVKKGDTLLILEAMKMENIIKSPIDGKIKAIKVNPGQNVDKNQVMIQFE
jgi:biotin carboxyl carrier protein